MKSHPLHIAINYYLSSSQQRQAELDHCITSNYQSGLFNTIINFSTQEEHQQLLQILKPYTSHTKIKHIYHQYRPKFNQIVQHLNNNYDNQICVISNLDILFNKTVMQATCIDLNNTLLCITRWEPNTNSWQQNVMHNFRGQWCIDRFNNLNHHASQSQDVWIFKAPLNVPYHSIDFPQGILGCEKIAYVAHQHGYKTINPCLTIKCYHHHPSQFRTYDPTFYLDHGQHQSEPQHIIYYV